MLRAICVILLLSAGLLYNPASLRAQDQRGIGDVKTGKTRKPAGNTYALIIGINYTRRKNFNKLNYAVNDAEMVKQFLQSGAFVDSIPEENIKSIFDSEATSAKLWYGFDWLKKAAHPGDKAIIYFAGHGVSSGPSLGFLIAFDSPDVTDPSMYGFSGGTIPVYQLKDDIRKLRENKVNTFLITDACRNNEKRDSSQYNFQTIMEKNEGEIQFSSCSRNQSSLEDQKWGGGHGLFTYYLVKGMSGFADDEGFKDGKVTLSELESYVKKHVQDDSRDLKENIPQQEPYINIENADNKQQPIAFVLPGNKVRDKFTEGNLLALDKRLLITDTSILLSNFQEALTRKNFFAEDPGNAFSLLQEIKRSRPPEQYNDAEQEYIIHLLNDAQVRINKYFEGLDTIYSARYFSLGARELNTALGFMSKDHPLYKGYNINRLFLEASGLRDKKSAFSMAMQKIDSAIAFDSTIAYLYNAKGLLNLDINQDVARSCFSKAHQLKPEWWFPVYNLIRCNKDLKAVKKSYFENLQTKDSVAWFQALAGLYKRENNFDSAQYYYKKCIANYPENPLYLNNYADLLSKFKKFDKAVYYLQKALDINPEEQVFLKNLGYIYTLTHEDAKAKEVLKKAVHLDSTNSYNWYFLGIYYHLRDPLDSAIICYEKGLACDSSNLYLYSAIGYAYVVLGKGEKAKEYHRLAIKADSTSADGWLDLGELYTDQGEYDSAETCLQKALLLDTISTKGMRDLGIVYKYLNKNEKALEVYRRAISINERETDNWYELGKYYSERVKKDSAVYCFRKCLWIDSSYTDAYYSLASGLVDNGVKSADTAIYLLKKAVSIDPFSVKNYELLADIYTGRKQVNSALTYLKTALALDTVNTAVVKSMASIYFDKGMFDSTLYILRKIYSGYDLFDEYYNGLYRKEKTRLLAYYKKLLSITHSYDTILLKRLGDMYFDRKNQEEAYKYYYLAYSKFPQKTSRETKLRLAGIYEKKQMLPKAISIYMILTVTDSTASEPYYHLGRIEEKNLKEPERAYAYYVKFMHRVQETTQNDYNWKIGETKIEYSLFDPKALNFIDKYLFSQGRYKEYIAFYKDQINASIKTRTYPDDLGYFSALYKGFTQLRQSDSIEFYSAIRNLLADNMTATRLKYAGDSSLEKKDFPKAVTQFRLAFDQQNLVRQHFSSYVPDPDIPAYLTICYLKMNRDDSAAYYLNTYAEFVNDEKSYGETWEGNLANACFYSVRNEKERALIYAERLLKSISNEYYLSDAEKREKFEKIKGEELLSNIIITDQFKTLAAKYKF